MAGDSDRRERLAAAQSRLLRCLMEAAEAPPGFASGDVEAAAEALASKRRHAVARAWPTVVRWLGVRFRERFDGFARSMSLPGEGGPLADGRAFVRELAREGPLPREVMRQVLAVDLRFRQTRRGLEPRRGLSVTWGRLEARGRVLLGVRWAGRGEHWLWFRRGDATPSP
jgi:hypothetical protein